MNLNNTPTAYGSIAMLLHWLMAVLIIGMLILGLYMADLPVSPQKLQLYGWHKEFGIFILMLAVMRLWWRLLSLTPRLEMPYWQVLIARSVHLAFYGFMFVLPITGWLMSSASGIPVSFFGWFTLPDLIAPNPTIRVLAREAHGWLAYGLIAAIVSHTAAALWHHWINKDDILRRMLP